MDGTSSGIDPAGLRARAAVLRAVRSTFDRRGYLEVPTPVLVPSPAMEPYLHPVAAGDGWLRTSPEFALKRAIASGLGRIYEIGPCFRDREHGDWHRREFTMCEWYRVGATLDDLMDEVEEVIAAAARAVSVAPPVWSRTTVRELMIRHAGLDPATASASDLTGDRAIDEGWDDAFTRRWVTDVEPALSGALFVSDWPAPAAALARVRSDGPWPVACRFEAYLDGIELANAFWELIDPVEQRRRFAEANAVRAAEGHPPHRVDERLVDAVGRMPPTSGIALGLDRLVAALCGWDGIGRARVE